MQPSINNNNIEKQADKWSGKAQDQINRGISEIKNFADNADMGELKAMAADITHRVRDASSDFYRDSVELVKKHPVRAALGLAAVSFVAGAFAARSRK